MNNIVLDQLNKLSENTLIEYLNIEFTEYKEECLVAKMPVTSIVHQPYGVLHGGASVVLAETLGSTLSNMLIDTKKYIAVGQQIDANHLKSKKEGFVYGYATVVKKGFRNHLVKIEIKDEEGKLICYSHITNAIIPNPNAEDGK